MRDLTDQILESKVFEDQVAAFQLVYRKNLEHRLGTVLELSSPREQLFALCESVRQLLMNRWIATQNHYHKARPKRLYYLSMEYLLGRLVKNALLNLDLLPVVQAAFAGLKLDFEAIAELEPDPGLGNGGLGRLAACFLDSLSSQSLPVYAYGIRYEFGMFRQVIEHQQQKETPDSWLRYGYPFEVEKDTHAYEVGFGGQSRFHENADGSLYAVWASQRNVLAVPYDIPVPGYGTQTVNTLRLWASKSDEDFHFAIFDAGDYVGAVMDKVESEALSKVLYPNDANAIGKLLRLKQQYFLVSASLQDILKEYKNEGYPLRQIPEQIVIQLNDTHPTLAIPELMRLLVDTEDLPWDEAWTITQKTIAFTNHTVMPEALETWPVRTLREVLPRHAQIIEELNLRFLKSLRERGIYDQGFIDRVALISRSPDPEIRMANMAIVASFAVNGVAALHTQLLKDKIFPEFYQLFPERFHNKTNGITHRRWLRLANPQLASLIDESIGNGWMQDLFQLRELERYVGDAGFLERLRMIKQNHKGHLSQIILQQTGVKVDPSSLFDVHVKRIHEYKRQLLKLLHCIQHYHYLREHYDEDVPARTVIFAGKAAPGYRMAKLLIHMIHAVAATINEDPLTRDRLKIVFLPNYNVSLAELIIPAADLSEQISTAGTEASGTGNMKFCLNGALILGTLDGANIEIRDHVGAENIFIFGHTVEELRALQSQGYNPHLWVEESRDLRLVLDAIEKGFFSKHDLDRFRPIWDSLMVYGDRFFHLADFTSYVEANQKVSALYQQVGEWQTKALLNIARIGWFSSDRTVREYTQDVWHLEATRIPLGR